MHVKENSLCYRGYGAAVSLSLFSRNKSLSGATVKTHRSHRLICWLSSSSEQSAKTPSTPVKSKTFSLRCCSPESQRLLGRFKSFLPASCNKKLSLLCRLPESSQTPSYIILGIKSAKGEFYTFSINPRKGDLNQRCQLPSAQGANIRFSIN